MSDTKQTWRLIVKKTGEVIIRSDGSLKDIKEKSLELIKARKGSKYRIQYFENDMIADTVKLTDYFG